MDDPVYYVLMNLLFSIDYDLLIFMILCLIVLLSFLIISCVENNTTINNNNNNDLVDVLIVATDPDLIRSIPIVDFNFKDFKNDVECVVCLSQLIEGDRVRVFPNCNHLFHVDCIDLWLRFHPTCPLCRKRVFSDQQGTRPELGGSDESVTQNHDSRYENSEFLTHSPRSGETVVVEDVGRSGVNEGPPELTAVVIDIPANRDFQ